MTPKPPQFSAVFAAHPNAAEMAQYAHVVWAETVAELTDCGGLAVSKKSRLATIERYARYRAEYQFNYAVCMKDGPVNKADSGGEYVNMSWAMLNKLDERLLKYDAVFASWTKGLSDEGRPPKALKKPAAADEYLARAEGKTLEEYRRERGIEQEQTGHTPNRPN